MIIGSFLENNTDEKRIVFSLDIIKKYAKNGFKVLLPRGYGIFSNISDQVLEDCGAILEDKDKIISQVDILVKISLEQDNPIENLKNESTIIVSDCDKNNENLIKKLKKKKLIYSL